MTAGRTRSPGFTLIEVLVALSIFAILAVAGVSVLAVSIDNRQSVEVANRATAGLQTTRALLRADLAQAVDRRVRDDQGRPEPQAFSGGEGQRLLALTRAGWVNPGAEARPSMQRVEYWLVEGRLERRAQPLLDGAATLPPQVLQEGVRAAEIAFVDRGAESSTWTPTLDRARPQAVRLTLDTRDQGRVSQLFLVGVGA